MRAYRDIIQEYGAKEITQAIKSLKKKVDKEWKEIPVKEREVLLNKYFSSSHSQE